MSGLDSDRSSPPPHVIRLRGPWQYHPLARTRLLSDGTTCETGAPLPPPGEMQIPADWGACLGREFRGRVRFSRRFGKPTGLSPASRVLLVIDEVMAVGTCWLNDVPLGTLAWGETPLRVDITAQLQPRNLLIVQIEMPASGAGSSGLRGGGAPDQPGGLTGEVRLEIHAGVDEPTPAGGES